MYPDNFNAYEEHGARLTGCHAALSGDDPEALAGPFLNLFKRIVQKVREKRAGKQVDLSVGPDNNITANVSDAQQASAASTIAPASSGLPKWAIPAGIGAAALVTVLAMRK